MEKIKFVVVERWITYAVIVVLSFFFIGVAPVFINFIYSYSNTFIDPENGVIVIDAGHGGIDGGASQYGVLEKDINLDIARKLRYYLEQKGYKVIMTRDTDTSLESLCDRGGSRYMRDLNARVGMINSSNAQMFLSIHTNYYPKNPQADGAIVFYNTRLEQNKDLAYCVQRALNNMVVNGEKRTVHDPREANYYVLSNSDIPGALVETAFISNSRERELLGTEEFRNDIAKAIVYGVENYLRNSCSV